MKTVTLEIYNSDELVCKIVGSARAVYYAAMNAIRFARYTGDAMPNMKCSNAAIDRYVGGIIAVENIYKFCTGEYTK